jgi:hypothetical protein
MTSAPKLGFIGSIEDVARAFYPGDERVGMARRCLKNQRMIAVGLISFYALESAMRVSEKEQVSLEG